MKYWMFIITEENWKTVKETNIIGSDYKDKIEKIDIGDKIIVYIKNPHCKITGLYEVLSRFHDNSKFFKKGVYAFRLKLKPLEILDKPIDFRKLISKLKFIKNKQKWYLHLYGIRGVKELSKMDFDLIFS